MIKTVKIYGAGSIGNHLAHASRRLGWDVSVCDTDPAATKRMVNEIYPARYGVWDDGIKIIGVDSCPEQYDLVIVGTPPDTHVEVAAGAILEARHALLIEKPLSTPSLLGLDDLWRAANIHGKRVFVGYDHVVSGSARKIDELIKNTVESFETLDVEFREHWGGIFSAHPWLNGPADSYLGHINRGGGASGEHSHALNLWQHFCHSAGGGRVKSVQATYDIVTTNDASYDKLCLFNLRSENNFLGRCVQDVITKPHRKTARIQYKNSNYEWECNAEPGKDRVKSMVNSEVCFYDYEKTRPDDFIQELRHINECLINNQSSPIDLSRGMDTMLVLAAGLKSHTEGRTVEIDYSKGYNDSALM